MTDDLGGHTYTAGQGFRTTAEVRDPQTGALFDPDEIMVRLKDPAGTVTAIVPVRLSEGIYEARGVFDKPGTWFRQWKVTYGINEVSIVVKKSHFP